jgi:hypothetical protein
MIDDVAKVCDACSEGDHMNCVDWDGFGLGEKDTVLCDCACEPLELR